MHKVLVNRLVKLAHETSVVRLNEHPDMTIAVDWDVKNQTKQTNTLCDGVTKVYPHEPGCNIHMIY